MPLQFLVYIHRFKVKQQSRHQCVIISRQRLQLWVLEDMALRPLWWNMQLRRRNTEEWLEQSWLLPDKKGQSNLRVTVDPCGCKALKLFTLNYQGACIMDWLPDSSVRCVSLPSASVSTTPSKWFTNKHSTVLLFVIQSSVLELNYVNCIPGGRNGNNSKNANPSIAVRICAGITTGGLAVLFAQPTDVVKVRMQAEARSLDGIRRYSGTMNAYSTIARKEGVAGLWKGIYTRNVLDFNLETKCIYSSF